MANELDDEIIAIVKLAPYLARWKDSFVEGRQIIWEDYEWDTYATTIVKLNWMSPVSPDSDGRMCIMRHSAHIRIEDGVLEMECRSLDASRLVDNIAYADRVGICGDWDGTLPLEFVEFMDTHFKREG